MNSSLENDPRWGRAYLVTAAAGTVVILIVLAYFLGYLTPPTASSSTSSATTSASYSLDAPSLMASTAAQLPPGYSEAAPRVLNASEPGLRDGAYSTLSSQAGSTANMTILVFDGPTSAQTYAQSVFSNAKGLVGYTDVSPGLAPYQHYGLCYGYGEDDPDGNGAVATGFCTRGNVYVQVHLVSHSPLSSAKQEMASLIGAAYNTIA